jgi:hypothetical protein
MARVRTAVVKGALGVRIPGSGSTAAMDISVDEQARSYKGHDIMKITYGKEAMASDPQMAAAMDAMPAMGLFMSTEIAFVDDMVIMTWGADSVMDRALDLSVNGSGNRIDRTPPYVSLFPIPSEGTVSMASIRLVNLIKAAMQMTAQGGASASSLDLPDTHSGIAAQSYMLDGKQVTVVRLGYEELVGLGACVQAAQQAAAAQYSGPSGMGTDSGYDDMAGSADAERSPEIATTPDKVCINQLRTVDAAKELYAMENSLSEGAEIPAGGLLKFLPGGVLPRCPLGSEYSIGTLGVAPTCPVEGHKLP